MQVLITDEFRHATLLRNCALQYPRAVGYPGTWKETLQEHREQMQTLTPEQLMVTIYVPERYAAKTLLRQAEIFREHGDEQTAQIFEEIHEDELTHVHVDGEILWHFMADPEKGPAVKELFHRMLKNGYRQFHYDFLRSR